MKRLVKDGKIILDGTLPKYAKEKLVCEELEKVEDILEEFKLENIEDLQKIVELYRDIYKYCKEGNWITIRNNEFLFCKVNKNKDTKEFQINRITNNKLKEYKK